jgi:hypothetical protein
MARRGEPLTATQRQNRWRARKRKAEIAAGLRPRRQKPLTASQRQSRWRVKKQRAEAAAEVSGEVRGKSRAPPTFAGRPSD